MASRKVIKTFTTSDYTKYSLLAGSTPGTPQSMCSISEDNHVVVHNQGNSNKYGYLARYSSKKAYGKSDSNNYRGNNKMEHGNGCCYIQPLRVIATKTSSGSTVQIFDAVTLKHMYSVSAAAGSGIAYDKITGQVIIRSSSYITVFPYTYFDGRTKGVGKKKVNIADLGGIRQDCGAYNGVLYSINSPGKTHSYMDCYNIGTGEYLGSYSIPSLKELESVDFIGNSCYGCSASTRYFLHFKGAFNLKGSKASIAGDTTSTNAGATGYQGGSYTTDEKVARESLIKNMGMRLKLIFN